MPNAQPPQLYLEHTRLASMAARQVAAEEMSERARAAREYREALARQQQEQAELRKQSRSQARNDISAEFFGQFGRSDR